MVREVASKTNDIAGDGTTTATVLAQAIVREGAKAVAAGMNPMDLKRGIDKAVTAVVEELKKRTNRGRAGPQRRGAHPGLREGLGCEVSSAGPNHRGPITRAFLEVLEALLWGFYNSRDGRCFPSYEAIAAKAECRNTVYEALKVLELAGVLTWAHCIARIQVRERDLFGVTTTWDVPHKKPLALRGRLRHTPPVTDPSLVGAVTVSRGRLDTAARRTTGYCGAGVIHPKGTAQV